jgi:hypothetical protein
MVEAIQGTADGFPFPRTFANSRRNLMPWSGGGANDCGQVREPTDAEGLSGFVFAVYKRRCFNK